MTDININEIEIKDAELKDLPLIAEGARDFLKETKINQIFDYDPNSFIRFLQYSLYVDSSALWMAKHNGLSVGALFVVSFPSIFNDNQLIGDILFVDVLPEYRRYGVAKKLFERLDIWAEDKNIHVLSFHLEHPEIIKGMERLGFKQIETRMMKKINRS